MRQEATVPPLLNLAWEKTGLVDGDPDAREELRVSLVREAAGRSDFAWCLLHIPQMDPKARGLAYAMASWDAANEGFPPRARELLQAAEQDNFIRTDEETARLQAYLAASEQRLGREKEAQRHLASILDVRGRGYAKALVQAAQWARNMPGAMGETKDFAPEAVPELVKSLDAVLRDEKQDHARKRQALLLAEKIVAKADPANGAQGWAQLALSAHAAGLLGEAAVCSRRSKDLAMSLDPRTEQYGISLAAAARALARCGDREDAQRCLDLAAAKPGVVALFFQPPVLMALAEAHQAMGDATKADEAWLKALEVARSHHHPRARAINVVLVLRSLLEAGREPTPDMVAVMDSIARGEGGTAALPPGYVRVEAKPANPPAKPKGTSK
ncbi:MAG: hypothetical protein EBT68_01300 [Verrucomicrobia bacterium]|nr:hypothetical protein [Verrucomicrobiota bacterium]NBR62788.1 hypothetical protein [Verrucomicrobiota bacterium]